MTIWALVLVGISLSMDAFAISILNGIAYNKGKQQIILTALAFGFAQALMPVIGYLIGISVSSFIEAYDHWVAFLLLLFIGGKMVYDSIKNLHSDEEPAAPELTPITLLLQAIATSIDALAVGISFAALQVNIISASAIIGLSTFIICLFGGAMGRRIGDHVQKYASLAGGIILILLGLKILFEHMGFI